MNPHRPTSDAPGLVGRYVRGMRAVRRVAVGHAGVILDGEIAFAAAALTATAAWAPTHDALNAVTGPAWLRALLPVLLGAPLVLRRRAPLVMWAAIWTAIALLDLVSRQPPHGLYLLFVLFVGAYSLGAHAHLRRAVAGLGLTVPALAVIGLGGVGLGLSVAPLAAFWLLGVLVRARRAQVALAARNSELEREAQAARAAERTRIARELHDIVAHHLSVIVLQAAGTRASGKPADAALEKIENSGRQALSETRRLLGVLRESDPATEFAPRPGIADLDALTASVRATGLPVNLNVKGELAELPAAIDVSVYRIVQEALTNVLKHANATHAEVTIARANGAVTIEVTDDGAAPPARLATATGGHGLTGMRERAAVFGGDLSAEPRPGSGFTVQARLPLQDGAS